MRQRRPIHPPSSDSGREGVRAKALHQLALQSVPNAAMGQQLNGNILAHLKRALSTRGRIRFHVLAEFACNSFHEIGDNLCGHFQDVPEMRKV